MALTKYQIRKLREKAREYNMYITPEYTRKLRKLAKKDFDEAFSYHINFLSNERYFEDGDISNLREAIEHVNNGDNEFLISGVKALSYMSIYGAIWAINLKTKGE